MDLLRVNTQQGFGQQSQDIGEHKDNATFER